MMTTPDALPDATVVFLLGLAGAAALYRALFTNREVAENRLLDPSYHRGAVGPTFKGGPADALETRPGWFTAIANRMGDRANPRPSRRALVTLLNNAGFNGFDKVVIFELSRLLSVAGCAVAGFGLGALHGGLGPALALLFGAVGYLIPTRVLRRMGRNRHARISRELPAILDLLTVCLEAGLALTEALRIIARRAERRASVLGPDLAVMTGELSAGLPLSEALRNLSDRAGNEDLKAVSALLIQSDRMGSSLAPALRAATEQLSTRRRMRAEERAQKAAVKMLVPLVLLILPAMLAVVLGPAFLQILAVVAK